MDRILCFDIGGTGVKAMLFDAAGKRLSEKFRIPTPRPATPTAILEVMQRISKLPAAKGGFNKIAAGFPGVVLNGVTLNAPNLSPKWRNFRFEEALEKKFRVAAKVANDADTQGLGASIGQGIELTMTLGTGAGSALVHNGILIPNLELGHHPFRKGETYEQQLGKAALDQIGLKRWNARVRKMLKQLSIAFNFDGLYLGGGNAKHVSIKLPPNVHLISNESGLLGGVKLWNPRAQVDVRSLDKIIEIKKAA